MIFGTGTQLIIETSKFILSNFTYGKHNLPKAFLFLLNRSLLECEVISLP